MNTIQAVYQSSEYSKEPHWVIVVDEQPLDVFLHQLYPEHNLIGLVPTLLDWLEDDKERRVVWTRIKDPKKQVVPLLMCPDDADFWCTLINVEIEHTKDAVIWHRMGLEKWLADDDSPESIGKEVEWLDKIPPLVFYKKEYEQFLLPFEEAILRDYFKKQLFPWIEKIDASENIPTSIQAFNFGLFETKQGFTVYLIGAKEYDLEDDDWAWSEDFVPKEKYLPLTVFSAQWTWRDILALVKQGLEEYVNYYRVAPTTFVHTAALVTTGFDSGELLPIERNK